MKDQLVVFKFHSYKDINYRLIYIYRTNSTFIDHYSISDITGDIVTSFF